MDPTFAAHTRHHRALFFVLGVLLVVGFLTGGSAQISGADDTAIQIFAVFVLVYALWALSAQPTSTLRNVALALAAAIVLIPILQLAAIPSSLWELPEARRQLAADLAAAEVVPSWQWSLDPDATLRGVWFLVPPLSAFSATLAISSEAHRGLLRVVMGLAFLSLLLAFLQLGVPAESLLNPFPRWAAQFNGVFANQNHQGIALVVAIVIALAGMLDSLTSAREGRRQAWMPWVLGFVALFALMALPLTGSRAAVLIAVFAVAAVPFALGLFNRRHLRASPWARGGLFACMGLVALGIWGTLGWMQVDAVDELRKPLREATLALGNEHAPLGTGVGAFVAAFEQGAPDALLMTSYVNHAHNDFLQWWMEAGWIGLFVGALVIGFFTILAARALAPTTSSRYPAVAAVLGLSALLMQSWVDYPLRTGSLSIVAAVLAGIVVSRGAFNSGRRSWRVGGNRLAAGR